MNAIQVWKIYELNMKTGKFLLVQPIVLHFDALQHVVMRHNSLNKCVSIEFSLCRLNQSRFYLFRFLWHIVILNFILSVMHIWHFSIRKNSIITLRMNVFTSFNTILMVTDIRLSEFEWSTHDDAISPWQVINLLIFFFAFVYFVFVLKNQNTTFFSRFTLKHPQ